MTDRDGDAPPIPDDAPDHPDDAPAYVADDVRGMVRHCRPEWRVREWTPAEEGTDFVAFVDAETPDGERAVVLKAASFLDAESFRPEVRTLELVGERTDIPVPAVLASCEAHDDLPAPFFLMERCDGAQVDGPAALSSDALDRLSRDAGRHLAALHGMATWDAYGRLRCAGDVAGPTGPGGLAPADATRDWRERLLDAAETQLSDLHPRFADLEGELRAAVEARLDAAPRRPDPVLVHGDYRYGNLLVDPESGAVRAALDWGNQSTGDAALDLVLAEQYLCEYAPRDDPIRRRVRDGIRAGYRERRSFEPDRARRELYLLQTRLAPLAWFDLWYGDDDRMAETHRSTVGEFV